jgi:RNA polymerase sigma-70 factor (ECF subfamily)
MEQLTGRYWKPVYCYLRRKGHDNESAKDLTQGFFGEIVLGRDLAGRADRSRGRFRTFLLTALDRYLLDQHRRQRAAKRASSSEMPPMPLEELPDLPADSRQAQPDQVFNYAWATALLDEVLAKVETDCRCSGQTVHWEVFKARVLTPILENAEPPSLETICARLGIQRQARASNMIVTVKRRFHSAMLETLGQHVDSPSEVEEELHDLMEALEEGGARS